MNPWFRMYNDFASDPKVQLLAFEDQRHFVVLLCLKNNGTLDTEVTSDSYRERLVAKALGLDPAAAAECKRRLLEAGLIDETWQPKAWEKRQFLSDSSANRVRKFREKQQVKRYSNGDVTDTKRPSNAIEQNRTEQNRTDIRAREGVPHETIDAGLAELKAVYPKTGRQNWLIAERKARQLIDAGEATWQSLKADAIRYANYCRATGRIAMAPDQWLTAPDEPWRQPWEVPTRETPKKPHTPPPDPRSVREQLAKLLPTFKGTDSQLAAQVPGASLTDVRLAREAQA